MADSSRRAEAGKHRMNITIWEYALRLQGTQSITMPTGATILSAHEQGDTVCLWAKVDPDEAACEERTIRLIGPGHLNDMEKLNFISTVISDPYVWHIFEETA